MKTYVLFFFLRTPKGRAEIALAFLKPLKL